MDNLIHEQDFPENRSVLDELAQRQKDWDDELMLDLVLGENWRNETEDGTVNR